MSHSSQFSFPAATPGGSDKQGHLNGLLFVALFAAAVTRLATLPSLAALGVSPLIVGIVAGAIYGNTLRAGMPAHWASGVNFAARRLLRIAVAFFGLRVSLQEIAQVGLPGLAVSVLVVLSTLAVGTWIGMRLFKLDRDTAMLTAAGSAICGAAAVLAFESTLQSKPEKSAVAVGSVVLFGTLSMLLYPLAYRAGWLHLDTTGVGLYFGGTIHEVAQVVGAASDVSPAATHANSLQALPHGVVQAANALDTFALTMAMTALGIETRLVHVRRAGPRALATGLVLYLWLSVAGLAITWGVQRYLG